MHVNHCNQTSPVVLPACTTTARGVRRHVCLLCRRRNFPQKYHFYLEASSTGGLSNGRHCCCIKCLPFMYMILHKFLSSSLLPMHKVGSLSTFPSYRGPVLLKYRVMITSTKCMLIVNVNQLFIVVIPGNGLSEGVVSGLIKILA